MAFDSTIIWEAKVLLLGVPKEIDALGRSGKIWSTCVSWRTSAENGRTMGCADAGLRISFTTSVEGISGKKK